MVVGGKPHLKLVVDQMEDDVMVVYMFNTDYEVQLGVDSSHYEYLFQMRKKNGCEDELVVGSLDGVLVLVGRENLKQGDQLPHHAVRLPGRGPYVCCRLAAREDYQDLVQVCNKAEIEKLN